MKIRIFGNSLRIRVSKSDLKTFEQEGKLTAVTEFVTHSLHYSLEKKEGIEQLEADFANNCITMSVPTAEANNWIKTETVGLSARREMPDGTSFKLLLEKDFKCIDNTGGEDQSDNFENPNHVC